jgi:hypothetical protein
MKCAEAEKLLPALAGGEDEREDGRLARAHAEACPRCGAALRELEATVGLCHAARAEPLPEDFAAGLHRKLVEAGPPRLPHGTRALEWLRQAVAARPLASLGAAAAVAALGASLLTIGMARRAPVPAAERWASEPMPRVPASKIALVRVDFVAAAPVEDVRFEILVPEGLRFFSSGRELSERSFQWRGRLGAGSNPIPVAVKGQRPGRYRLIAHATGVDLDVTEEVWIEVTS